MYLCPGRECWKRPEGFCHRAKKIYDATSADDPADIKERKIAGRLRKRIVHVYYCIDVTPIVESGGKPVIPECFGDQQKHGQPGDVQPHVYESCAECPMIKQCFDGYSFIRFNFGSRGKSNGELLMAAYNDDVDMMVEVFNVDPDPNSGRVVSRPIKIVNTKSGDFASYRMQGHRNKVSMSERVIHTLGSMMKPVEETIFNAAMLSDEELFALMRESGETTIEVETQPAGTEPTDADKFNSSVDRVSNSYDHADDDTVPPDDTPQSKEKLDCFGDAQWYDMDVEPCSSCSVSTDCKVTIDGKK